MGLHEAAAVTTHVGNGARCLISASGTSIITDTIHFIFDEHCAITSRRVDHAEEIDLNRGAALGISITSDGVRFVQAPGGFGYD